MSVIDNHCALFFTAQHFKAAGNRFDEVNRGEGFFCAEAEAEQREVAGAQVHQVEAAEKFCLDKIALLRKQQHTTIAVKSCFDVGDQCIG